jgi:hypothetical protein
VWARKPGRSCRIRTWPDGEGRRGLAAKCALPVGSHDYTMSDQRTLDPKTGTIAAGEIETAREDPGMGYRIATPRSSSSSPV